LVDGFFIRGGCHPHRYHSLGLSFMVHGDERIPARLRTKPQEYSMFTAAPKETFNDVKSDIKNGANRVGEEVRRTANNVRNSMNHDSLETTAHNIGQTVHDYIDNATDQINDAGNRVTSEIRNNPVQSTIVALAAGFLVGILARR
jgi:ElaB/YqjD/DUF883 family membrane-anchored ribosome-binding protein